MLPEAPGIVCGTTVVEQAVELQRGPLTQGKSAT